MMLAVDSIVVDLLGTGKSQMIFDFQTYPKAKRFAELWTFDKFRGFLQHLLSGVVEQYDQT